ncbi:hypothetical protein ERO13_A09G168150v2 [Gossypium hirsutum]|uniref:Secreted protein n=1 Tax=Gossypium mustelinum TaxID=34275 RepID=A0A5D2XYW0_GOSMU|nr:hypothetical protein ERO13_A09G168150v2 [Gossypium hirsutum]TYJ19258.1 hypothetical protein E1A91_A09G180400v1 [Gossypium mustelinum]
MFLFFYLLFSFFFLHRNPSHLCCRNCFSCAAVAAFPVPSPILFSTTAHLVTLAPLDHSSQRS